MITDSFFEQNKPDFIKEIVDFTFKYEYRKQIPKKDYIFFIIIILKYIGPVLISNTNINNKEENKISINTILSKLIISSISQKNLNYNLLVFLIYIFLLIHFIIDLILHLTKRNLASNLEIKKYNNYFNEIKISTLVKTANESYLIFNLIINFFSQHIQEGLVLGIFYVLIDDNFADKNKIDLNEFSNKLLLNKTLLVIINFIFLIYLFYIQFRFFTLHMSDLYQNSIGFKWIYKSFINVIIIIYSFLLGIYSILAQSSIEKSKKYKVLSVFFVFFTSLSFIFNVIKEKIFIISTNKKFIYNIIPLFLSNLCLVCSFYEIIIYFFIRSSISQSELVYKIIVEIVNSILLTYLIYKSNNKYYINYFSKELFLSAKVEKQDDIEILCHNLKYIMNIIIPNNTNKFNQIFNLNILSDIYSFHKLNYCNNKENCSCLLFNQMRGLNIKNKMEIFIEYLLYYKIKAYIDKSLLIKPKIKIQKELEYINLNYELYINKNYLKFIYLTNSYITNTKLDKKYKYNLFELRKLSDGQYETEVTNDLNKKIDLLNHSTYTDKDVNNTQVCSYKLTLKDINEIINEENNIEKMREILFNICDKYNKILNFRNVYNSKMNINITNDSFINELKSYSNYLKELKIFFDFYFRNNYNRHNNLVKYLLNNFLNILKTESKTLKKYIKYNPENNIDNIDKAFNNEIVEQVNDIIFNEKDSFMIFNLIDDNKIINKYTSVKLFSILKYDRKDLINQDISVILPNTLNREHNEMIKKFIIYCDTNDSFIKNTYLLSKNTNIIPIQFEARTVLHINSPNILLVKINTIDKSNDLSYIYYDAILNDLYEFNNITREFKRDFFINIDTLKRYKITFNKFFGFTNEIINNNFKKKIKGITMDIKLWKPSTLNKLKCLPRNLYNKFEEIIYSKGNEPTIINLKVTREQFILSINEVLKMLNDSEKENIFNISYSLLLDKFKPNTKSTSISNENKEICTKTATIAEQLKFPKDEIFTIHLEKKKIGNEKYYIAKIKYKQNINKQIKEIKQIKRFSRLNQFTFMKRTMETSDTIVNLNTRKNNLLIDHGECMGRMNTSIKCNTNSNGIVNLNFNNISNSLYSNIERYTATNNSLINLSYINNNEKQDNYDFSKFHKPTFKVNNPVDISNINYLEMNTSANQTNSFQKSSSNLIKSRSSSHSIFNESLLKVKSKGKTKAKKNKINFNELKINVEYVYITNIKYNKVKNFNNYLLISKIIFYILLFCIFAFGYIKSKQNLEKSNDLIKLNSSTYLLLYDIYSNTILSLRGCFIFSNIQNGTKIAYANNKELFNQFFINNYQTFLNDVNDLIISSHVNNLASILNKQRQFYYMRNDWEEHVINNSFVEELRYLSYLFNNFNLIDNSTCRISQLFISDNNSNSIKEMSKPSFEEKLIYYIEKNILGELNIAFSEIEKISFEEMEKSRDLSKFLSIGLNCFFIFFGLFFHLSSIIFIVINIKIYKKYLVDLLRSNPITIIISNRLNLYMKLLDNFSYIQAQNFESAIINDNWDQINNDPFTQGDLLSSLSKGKNISYKSSENRLDHSSNRLNSKKNNPLYKLPNKLIENNNSLNSSGNGELLNKKKYNVIKGPKIQKISISIIIVLFTIFILLQIINLIINFIYVERLYLSTDIGITFYAHIPKVMELLIYSYISVLNRDPELLKNNFNIDKEGILGNYFNIEINYNKDSLYKTLKKSEYYNLYYTFLIYSENIDKFTYSKTKNSLNNVKKLNKEFNEENNLCIYGRIYANKYNFDLQMNNINSFRDYVLLINKFTSECKNGKNGINLNGLKYTLDVFIKQLNDAYSNFVFSNKKYLDVIKFISNEYIINLSDNFIDFLWTYYYVINYYVLDDFVKSNNKHQDAYIIITCISLGIPVILFFYFFLFVKRRIEDIICVIKEFTNKFYMLLNDYLKEAKRKQGDN